MWEKPPAPFAPDDEALLDKLATLALRFGMGVPAIFFLESVKPLNFVGAQVLVFFGPVVTAFFPAQAYDRLTALLERRDTLEALILKIERGLDEPRKPVPPTRAEPKTAGAEDAQR